MDMDRNTNTMGVVAVVGNGLEMKKKMAVVVELMV
jgi:hypothetical protein